MKKNVFTASMVILIFFFTAAALLYCTYDYFMQLVAIVKLDF